MNASHEVSDSILFKHLSSTFVSGDGVLLDVCRKQESFIEASEQR